MRLFKMPRCCAFVKNFNQNLTKFLILLLTIQKICDIVALGVNDYINFFRVYVNVYTIKRR